MDAPYYNGPDEREDEPRRELTPEPDLCRDCGDRFWDGGHSTPSARFCDPCWRWRQARGWEFDGRTKAQLEAAARGPRR